MNFEAANDFITLNNLCVSVINVAELIEKVYPDITNMSTNPLNRFQ